MRFYEIQLPARDNRKQDTYVARQQFERAALKAVGGFNRGPNSQGAWKDGATVYRDTMVPYRVACTEEQFAGLLMTAFQLFPDQLAIFTADLGTAHIAERPAVQSIAA